MPWLPEPQQPAGPLLEVLTGQDHAQADDERAWLRLAGQRWDEGQLRRIGRAFEAYRLAGQHAGRSAGQSVGQSVGKAAISGFAPLKLLVFSNATASHWREPLIATGLRHGLELQVEIVEFEEPGAWLARQAEAVQEPAEAESGARTGVIGRPVDLVLLHYDASAFHLGSTLPGADQESDLLASAEAHLSSLVAQITQATGKQVILQSVVADPNSPALHIDSRVPGSTRRVYAGFNAIIERVAEAQGCLVLDVAMIAQRIGVQNWCSNRYWYAYRHPFAPDCVPLFADHLCRILACVAGRSRRVLVLDLDNTLWNGVVGDDGMEGIRLGGDDPTGAPHAAIQNMARHYRARGIVLAVSSKNHEEVALEVFREHPDMVLKEEEIALFRVNWSDKAANIAGMSDALSLGLNSFVFLDDNPAERARVREALPEIAVPDLPDSPAEWLGVFEAAGYFEQVAYSAEDEQRADYYRANARRTEQQQGFADHDQYLQSLQMVADIRPCDAAGRKRVAQLISKSNQFNLTTRRYTEVEIARMESDPGWLTLQVRLVDRFGDNGMVSVVLCEKSPEEWRIDLWLMSCRVLGRGLERTVLEVLAERAIGAGARALTGDYIPTAKNRLVKDHYPGLGFSPVLESESGATRWRLEMSEFQPCDNDPIEVVDSDR